MTDKITRMFNNRAGRVYLAAAALFLAVGAGMGVATRDLLQKERDFTKNYTAMQAWAGKNPGACQATMGMRCDDALNVGKTASRMGEIEGGGAAFLALGLAGVLARRAYKGAPLPPLNP